MKTLPLNHERKFICDYSLFRVAKHLRLLGYECVCDQSYTHGYLLWLARTEGYTVLTRSKKLLPQLSKKPRAPRPWEVYSDDEDEPSEGQCERLVEYLMIPVNLKFAEQLSYILEHYEIEYDANRIFTRCLKCGTSVEEIEKAEVESRVPASVYLHYAQFFICRKCDKVYWGVQNGNDVCNWKAMKTLQFVLPYCPKDALAHGSTWKLHPFRVITKALKFKVLAFLPNRDLGALSLSAKSYYELTNCDIVWIPRMIGTNGEVDDNARTYAMEPEVGKIGGAADRREAKYGLRPNFLEPCTYKRRYIELKKSMANAMTK